MLLAIKFVLCLFFIFLSTQATNQKWPRTFVCAKNCISVCWFLSTHSYLRFKLYYHMKRLVLIKSGVYSFFKHIISTKCTYQMLLRNMLVNIWYWMIFYWHFIPHWFLFSYTVFCQQQYKLMFMAEAFNMPVNNSLHVRHINSPFVESCTSCLWP